MKNKLLAMLMVISLAGGIGSTTVYAKDNDRVNRSNQILVQAEDSTSSNFMVQVEELILTKVNEERRKSGLIELNLNSTMKKYARIKSQDMGKNKYFNHTDLYGNLILDKMKEDGISYSAWGENIAYISGISNVEDLANKFMENWMNSEGHRQNILSKNFTSIGIGVYKIGNEVYATQEFLR